jgi:hypothetical protein
MESYRRGFYQFFLELPFSFLEATLKCCPPSPLGMEHKVVVVKMQLWTLEASVEGPWKDSHIVEACVMKSLQVSVSVSICHMKKIPCILLQGAAPESFNVQTQNIPTSDFVPCYLGFGGNASRILVQFLVS